ncbi:MAG: replication initiator protein A, partial [Pseudomonadota bacterium]
MVAEDTHKRTGKLLRLTVTLSEWLANAIQHRDLLTLNPNYFRLKRPLSRRIYEIGRKRCGKQKQWPGL